MNPDREQMKHLARLVTASLNKHAMQPWKPGYAVPGVSVEAAVVANNAIGRMVK